MGLCISRSPNPAMWGLNTASLAELELAFGIGWGLASLRGRRSCRERKKNPKNDRQWDSCGLNLVFLLLGCGCINFHKC